MRNLTRGLVLATATVLTLVPMQPAWADGGLDIDIETANRITGSVHRVTVTLTAVAGAPASINNQAIDFELSGPTAGDSDGGQAVAPADGTCMTDVAGKCTIKTTSTTEGTTTIRAWHRDGSTLPCNPATPAVPGQDCDPSEGRDETTTPGANAETPNPDDTDVVEVSWFDGFLDVAEEPEPSVSPGGMVTLVASLLEKGVAAGGTPKTLIGHINAEVINGPSKNVVGTGPDAKCDTDQATGNCNLTYTAGSTPGVDDVQAWLDKNYDPGGPGTPVVAPAGDEVPPAAGELDASEKANEKDPAGGAGDTPEDDTTDRLNVNVSGGQVLDISPETSTKALGAQSALTAFLSSPGGTPATGVAIAAQVMTGGANAAKTATCTTTAAGTCSLNYVGTVAGTDKVQAAVDSDANGLPNEADSTEDVTNTGAGAGGTPEPDSTDVAQITWGTPTPAPGAGGSKKQCDRTRETANKAEVIVGTPKNDKLCGFGGNDSVRGGKGNDTLNGGGGKDTLKGGADNDKIKGQGGKDEAFGGSGEDSCGAEKEKGCEKGKR